MADISAIALIESNFTVQITAKDVDGNPLTFPVLDNAVLSWAESEDEEEFLEDSEDDEDDPDSTVETVDLIDLTIRVSPAALREYLVLTKAENICVRIAYKDQAGEVAFTRVYENEADEEWIAPYLTLTSGDRKHSPGLDLEALLSIPYNSSVQFLLP